MIDFFSYFVIHTEFALATFGFDSWFLIRSHKQEVQVSSAVHKNKINGMKKIFIQSHFEKKINFYHSMSNIDPFQALFLRFYDLVHNPTFLLLYTLRYYCAVNVQLSSFLTFITSLLDIYKLWEGHVNLYGKPNKELYCPCHEAWRAFSLTNVCMYVCIPLHMSHIWFPLNNSSSPNIISYLYKSSFIFVLKSCMLKNL